MPDCKRCDGELEQQESGWFNCPKCEMEIAPENLQQ